MYYLTLTHQERKAIDWIGHRYFHGDELYTLLWHGCPLTSSNDWESNKDITFEIPEHIAWQIRDGAELEDNQWACFTEELKDKMQQFVDSIV